MASPTLWMPKWAPTSQQAAPATRGSNASAAPISGSPPSRQFAENGASVQRAPRARPARTVTGQYCSGLRVTSAAAQRRMEAAIDTSLPDRLDIQRIRRMLRAIDRQRRIARLPVGPARDTVEP